MDKAEVTGLGVATAGHLALLAALSFGIAVSRAPPPRSVPIEVELVDEVGLVSTAPSPSDAAPAPLLAPEEGPPAPAMPSPPQVQAVPVPTPAAAPRPAAAAPRPEPRPAPPPRAAAAPAKAPPAARRAVSRSTGRLTGLLTGVSDRVSDRPAAATPAAATGAEVASLQAEVRRQIKPHWDSPTGVDVELLRTELSIWLARDGTVSRVEVIRTTGQTASNRPQVKLHQEKAVRAARLASPFKLPDKYYETWKYLSPIRFDWKLAR